MLLRMSSDLIVCIDTPQGIETNLVLANLIFERNTKTENDVLRDKVIK
jgi:hypothetical protein